MKTPSFIGSYFGFILLWVLTAQQMNAWLQLLGSGVLAATAVVVLWWAFSQSNWALRRRRSGLALVLLGFIGVLHSPISAPFALVALVAIISGAVLFAFGDDTPSSERAPR